MRAQRHCFQVRVVRQGQALEGLELRVLGGCRRCGQLQLLLILPDESRALVPACWTSLQAPDDASLPGAVVTPAPALLATMEDLRKGRVVVDALLGRLADAKENDDPTRTGAGRSARGHPCAVGSTRFGPEGGSAPTPGLGHRQGRRTCKR